MRATALPGHLSRSPSLLCRDSATPCPRLPVVSSLSSGSRAKAASSECSRPSHRGQGESWGQWGLSFTEHVSRAGHPPTCACHGIVDLSLRQGRRLLPVHTSIFQCRGERPTGPESPGQAREQEGSGVSDPGHMLALPWPSLGAGAGSSGSRLRSPCAVSGQSPHSVRLQGRARGLPAGHPRASCEQGQCVGWTLGHTPQRAGLPGRAWHHVLCPEEALNSL